MKQVLPAQILLLTIIVWGCSNVNENSKTTACQQIKTYLIRVA